MSWMLACDFGVIWCWYVCVWTSLKTPAKRPVPLRGTLTTKGAFLCCPPPARRRPPSRIKQVARPNCVEEPLWKMARRTPQQGASSAAGAGGRTFAPPRPPLGLRLPSGAPPVPACCRCVLDCGRCRCKRRRGPRAQFDSALRSF